MAKYNLINEQGLFRIQALVDIPDQNVKARDLGGLVASEGNLSQEGTCWIYGNAIVSDNARVYDNAIVYGNARVYDNARVSGNAIVSGNARVYGNAIVSDNARVHDNARIYGNAEISASSDYLTISPIGSEGGCLTAFKTKQGISVNRGCFSGTLDEFTEAVAETHRDNKYAKQYQLAIELIKSSL